MIADLKEVLHRSRNTLVQDMAGAVILMSLLVAALHLPSMF